MLKVKSGIAHAAVGLLKMHNMITDARMHHDHHIHDSQTISLDQATPNIPYLIHKLTGIDADRNKLNAMGFTPGTEVMLTTEPTGLCVLKLRGSKLMLNIELAKSIMCHSLK